MRLGAPVPTRPFWRRRTSSIAMAALLPLFLWFTATSAHAEDAVQVTGLDGSAQTWTAARLKEVLASDVKAIEWTSHGQKHASSSVPLIAVLKASGVPVALKMDPKADPHLKNYNLRLAVVIQGGDGYTATFSLAELLPEIGGREAWLAFDEDGKPLPDRDGMAKLLVPADQKPGRWVRNVARISVVDPAAATTQSTSQGIKG
jgi:hypothetical protein